MKRWVQSLAEKMRAWMHGRYGEDELSRFVVVTAMAVILLSNFFRHKEIVYLAAMVPLIWQAFRVFSRNIEKRKKERDVFLRFVGKIKHFFTLRKNMWRERRTHRYYKCPNCKVHLRVPKGRGKIEISCPKCRIKITRKT